MIELVQQKTFLIGTKDACEKLAEKEQAQLLVCSDSHGAHDVIRRIIMRFGAESDALIFCGDGIPDLLMNLESSLHNEELAKNIPPVIAFVQGNGDRDRYPIPEQAGTFSIPAEQEFKAAGMNIFVTHGHRYDVYYGTQMMADYARSEYNADFVCYGHTHISGEEKNGDLPLLNPGSCARPRGGQPPSTAIVTVSHKKNSCISVFYKITTDSFEPMTRQHTALFW